MPLTAADIESGISQFNVQYPEPNVDNALKTTMDALNALPPTVERFLAVVHWIAAWGSIPYFPFQERVLVANAVAEHWESLAGLTTLTEDSWLDDPTAMTSALAIIEPTGILQPPGATASRLSFTSKFLHWQISRAFPIWDNNARQVLQDRGYPVNSNTTWESYAEWTNLTRCLILEHQATLNALKKPDETLVRTLDKALWKLGQMG